MEKAKRFEIVEGAMILVALASLWGTVIGYHEWWYRGWLVVVLGLMVWVTLRRMARVRAAADEAKRKREQMERGGRPPLLR
jgi:hypothetical protein